MKTVIGVEPSRAAVEAGPVAEGRRDFEAACATRIHRDDPGVKQAGALLHLEHGRRVHRVLAHRLGDCLRQRLVFAAPAALAVATPLGPGIADDGQGQHHGKGADDKIAEHHFEFPRAAWHRS